MRHTFFKTAHRMCIGGDWVFVFKDAGRLYESRRTGCGDCDAGFRLARCVL